MSNTMEIKGYCDDRFAGVKEAFTNNFIEGKEKGASVCIHHAGTKAVDLWAGSADREGKREWQEDTIVNIASSTKGFGSACIHLLCDRGLLDSRLRGNDILKRKWAFYETVNIQLKKRGLKK